MNRYAITGFTVLVILFSIVPISLRGGIVATDDFNRDNMSSLGYGWNDSGHMFEISSNKAVCSGTANCIATRSDIILGTGAFTMQCNLSSPASSSNYVGLVFNVQDTNNYYVVRQTQNGYTQFLKCVDGTFSYMSSSGYYTGAVVKVAHDGNSNYKFYADGIEKVSWSDNTFTSGEVGIYANYAAEFDNFSVFVTDDFGQNDARKLDNVWIDPSNTFSIKNNAAVSRGGTNAIAMRYDTSLTSGPFSIQCDVSGPAFDNQFAGLAFNIQDENNYYVVRRTIHGYTQFLAYVDGSVDYLAASNYYTGTNMRIEHTGAGNYKFYVDGVEKASWSDDTFSSGRLGLYANETGTFTNLKISVLEDFNRTDSSTLGYTWIDNSSAFSISGNAAQSSGFDNAIATKLSDPLNSKPFTIKCDVSGPSSNSQFAGLAFNYQDANNYYVVRRTINSYTQFLKCVNGAFNILATAKTCPGNQMKVECDGSGNYKFYVDNVLYASWNDTTFIGGRIGIYSNLAGKFDNFSTSTEYDFNPTELNYNWYDISNAFYVSDKKAVSNGKQNALAIRSDIVLDTSPFTVQCNISGLANNTQYAGLVFNFQDERHYYIVRKTIGGFTQFLKCEEGTLTEVTGSGSYPGTTMKIEYNGNGNYNFYVDNSLKKSWNDTTFTGGGIGLYSNSAGEFDDFAVTCTQTQPFAEATVNVNSSQALGAINRKVMGHMLIGADSQYIWGDPEPNLVLRIQGNGIWDNFNNCPNAISAALLKEMKPNIIRYPGGSDVKNFYWKTTVGTMEERGENWHWGLMEFLEVCEYVGAEPQICLSSYYNHDQPQVIGDPEDQKDLVEFLNMPATSDYPWAMKRAEWGHPEPYGVKYFELGNEPYDGNRQVTPYKKWIVEDYADWALETISLMRSLDSTIKIGLPKWNNKTDTEWLIENIGPYVDFVIVHKYPVSYGGSADLSETEVNNIFTAFMAAGDQFMHELNELQQRYSTLAEKNMPLAVTEFNVFTLSSNPVSFMRTLGAGIMNVDLMVKMLDPCNNILLANYFQVFNDYWGSLRNDSQNWYQPDSWETFAPYHCFKLLSKYKGDVLVDSNVTCSKIDFPGFCDISKFTGQSYIPECKLSNENLLNFTTDFTPLSSSNYNFTYDSISLVKITCNMLPTSYLGFMNVNASNFPVEYQPFNSGIKYKLSFDSRWVPEANSGKPTLGLGLADGRGWLVSGSAIGIDGIETNIASPLNDNFDRSNSLSLGSTWNDIRGQYRIEDNKAEYTATTYEGIAILNNVDLETFDFTVQCDLAGPTNNTEWVGLVFNFQDENNYYVVRQTINGYTQFLKYVNGTFSELVTAGPYSGTTTRIDYTGNGNYKFYKDGVLRVEWSDNTFVGGKVGLYANNIVNFDNFSFAFGEWKHYEGFYYPLSDMASMFVTFRVFDDISSDGASGLLEAQNIKIEPWREAVYPAFDELRTIASLSSDGNKLYLMIINKNLNIGESVKTTINLNDFTPASAKLWTLNGPSVMSVAGVKEIISGRNVPIGPSGKVEYVSPAHSISIIEFHK